MEAITIEPVNKRILVLPMLLEADPSREMVLQYLLTGECFAATNGGKILGAYVVQRTRPYTMELLNVVVQENFRKLGIGTLLVADAMVRARTEGAQFLEVGIGNSNLSALAFYQKQGFRIRSVEQGYYERFYPDQLVENGIPRRDMVRLRLDL